MQQDPALLVEMMRRGLPISEEERAIARQFMIQDIQSRSSTPTDDGFRPASGGDEKEHGLGGFLSGVGESLKGLVTGPLHIAGQVGKFALNPAFSQGRREATAELGGVVRGMAENVPNEISSGVSRLGELMSPEGGLSANTSPSEFLGRAIPALTDIGIGAAPLIGGALGGPGGAAAGFALGPFLSHTQETAEGGEFAKAAGQLTGLAAPLGAAKGLGRVRPRATEPRGVNITRPSGSRELVEITAGEAGEFFPSLTERIGRGSHIAKPIVDPFELRRGGQVNRAVKLTLDDLAIERAPNVSLAGRDLQRTISRNLEKAEAEFGGRINAAETAAEASGQTTMLPKFREVAGELATRRKAVSKVAARRGDKQAIAELEGAAGTQETSAVARALENIPEHRHAQMLEVMLDQGVRSGPRAVPVVDAMKLLKNLKREKRSMGQPKAGPSPSSRELGSQISALQSDIVAALKAVNPRLATQWLRANKGFKGAMARKHNEVLAGVLKKNTIKAVDALDTMDPFQIRQVRKTIGTREWSRVTTSLLERRASQFWQDAMDMGLKGQGHPGIIATEFSNWVRRIRVDGTGNSLFGRPGMESLESMHQAAQLVGAARGAPPVTVMSVVIDASVALKLPAILARGALGGALGGLPGAMAGVLVPAKALQIAMKISVSPKFAVRNALQRAIKATGKPAEYAFWIARLGEEIEKDEELSELVRESVQQPEQPQQFTMGVPPREQRVQPGMAAPLQPPVEQEPLPTFPMPASPQGPPVDNIRDSNSGVRPAAAKEKAFLRSVGAGAAPPTPAGRVDFGPPEGGGTTSMVASRPGAVPVRKSEITRAALEFKPDEVVPTGNFNEGRNKDVTGIVLHATGGTYESALATFQNPGEKRSSHYVIKRDGTVVQFVAPENRAWHARDVGFNEDSIGIEFVGTAEDPEGFEEAQYLAAEALIESLKAKFPIQWMVPHSVVGTDVKPDPGSFFDSERFNFSSPPDIDRRVRNVRDVVFQR